MTIRIRNSIDPKLVAGLTVREVSGIDPRMVVRSNSLADPVKRKLRNKTRRS